MSFSASCPVAIAEARNAALEALGWGPDNFVVPLRPNGTAQGQGGTHAALHHLGNDPTFRAALLALPGVTVTDGAQLVVNFPAHVAAQALEWTDPTNWYLAPVMIGAQRTSGGKLWESLVDFNVWEPPVAWREIVAEGYPAWVQPTGAHDAYPMGFRVTFNGQNWESVIAANVWSPIAYPAGWSLLP